MQKIVARLEASTERGEPRVREWSVTEAHSDWWDVLPEAFALARAPDIRSATFFFSREPGRVAFRVIKHEGVMRC
jgi:hypothetical protein